MLSKPYKISFHPKSLILKIVTTIICLVIYILISKPKQMEPVMRLRIPKWNAFLLVRKGHRNSIINRHHYGGNI